MLRTQWCKKRFESSVHAGQLKHLRRQSPRPFPLSLESSPFQVLSVRSITIKVIKTQTDSPRPCFSIQTTQEDHNPLKVRLRWHVQVKLQIPKLKPTSHKLPKPEIFLKFSHPKMFERPNQHFLVSSGQQMVKLHEVPLFGQ